MQFITVYQIAETEKPASTYKPQTMQTWWKRGCLPFQAEQKQISFKRSLYSIEEFSCYKDLATYNVPDFLMYNFCQFESMNHKTI